MSESSGELTPPLESPEKVSKTGQMLTGLLAASREPVTLEMLTEWTGNSSEEVQTELVRLGYNPLTPVGELGVLIRVSDKAFSDEKEALQKEYGENIPHEKDLPRSYRDARSKLESLQERLTDFTKNPDRAISRYDEPVYGLNHMQYDAAKKMLGDDSGNFLEYHHIISNTALSKISSMLKRLGR